MFKLTTTGIWFLLGFLTFSSLASAQPAQKPTIERIDLRGNRRIPEDTCRFYIQSRVGDPYDVNRLELDLRALYNAKFFETIEVQERDGDTGKIVTFVFKEKPLIRAIAYEGNKSFTESNILEHFKDRKVGLTVDSQYDPSKIRAAERALRELLEQNGKPLGTVRSEIENIPPPSVRVRFIMEEGPKVRIGQIHFVGSRVYSDAQLKSTLKLDKERGPITMFKGTDKYNEAKLESDIETNLKAYYKEHGYMQVQVGNPVTRIFEGPRGMIPMFRKTKQQFTIEIPIEAGEQFRVGKLEIENCGIFKCEALALLFGMRKGDVVNFKRVKDTLEGIKKLYGSQGYINWSYIPEQSFDPKAMTMDLSFKFEPDKQFFVNRINFGGNTKTRDKVMRREFILEEGKVFSSQALDMSVLRLNQLGFFEKIEEKDYEVKPDDKTGQVDVNLKVKEKSMQSIGLTGGVSGISGSFIGLNYTTNNFRGRGETVEFNVQLGTRQTSYVVSFTEPYLFDSRWSMGLSLFNQKMSYDTYSLFGLASTTNNSPTLLFTQSTTGTTLTLNRRIKRTFWSLGTSYTFQRIGIGNIAPGFETYALGQLVGLVPGGNANAALSGIMRSEITPTLSYNSTNNYFNPTRGTALTLSVPISGGVLGGDFSMVRPTVEYRHFIPDRWLSHGRNTFGFRFMGEYIRSYGGSTVPFFDRFFIGGETTIRGFSIRSISPLAITASPVLDFRGNPVIDLNSGLKKISKSLIAIGGDTMGIFNGEYRIPIAGPLSMAAFYDLGLTRVSNAQSLGTFGTSTISLVGSSNNAIRGSTGLEFQFLLPVVSAPFRLIFAFNPQIYDNTVNVGTAPTHIKEASHDIKFTIGRSF